MDDEEKNDYSACETDAELDSEVEEEDTEAEQQLTIWLDQLHTLQQVGDYLA